MDRLKGLIRRSDSVSEWSGGICAWLAVPLVGFTAYDVITIENLSHIPNSVEQ